MARGGGRLRGVRAGARAQRARSRAQYGECVAEDGRERLRRAARRLRLRPAHRRAAPRCSARSREALPPLVGEARGALRRARTLEVPVAAQQAAVDGHAARGSGWTPESWRVDVSAHPFTAWIGRRDTRVTTRYSDGNVESLLSSLHEYGHALYERQIDPALRAHQPRARAPRCRSTSPRASCGRTTSPATPRSPRCSRPSSARAASRSTPRGAARERWSGVEPLADPRLRRPADLPAAHHPALRARARPDRRRAGRGRPAGRVARGRCAACSASRSPPTRSAACRTCTGARAASATSRAMRSAA